MVIYKTKMSIVHIQCLLIIYGMVAFWLVSSLHPLFVLCLSLQVGMVWKCHSHLVWLVFRVPSLHALVFIQKTFCDLYYYKCCIYHWCQVVAVCQSGVIALILLFCHHHCLKAIWNSIKIGETIALCAIPNSYTVHYFTSAILQHTDSINITQP